MKKLILYLIILSSLLTMILAYYLYPRNFSIEMDDIQYITDIELIYYYNALKKYDSDQEITANEKEKIVSIFKSYKYYRVLYSYRNINSDKFLAMGFLLKKDNKSIVKMVQIYDNNIITIDNIAYRINPKSGTVIIEQLLGIFKIYE